MNRPVLSEYPGSTTLSPQITSYELLGARIKMRLGYPLVNVEIADEQLYDCISESIELYTKFSGYTEEYLVFDSSLYTPGVGIAIDKLASRTPTMTTSQVSGLSAIFDYDLNCYRKVIDCFSFDPSNSTGINTLFTLEQTMAQQVYSNYMIGNYGFDLVAWEVMKGFIETRAKVLGMIPYFQFDSRRQLLKLIPEPKVAEPYLGAVGCYIEKAIKDLVCERWVQDYATALIKITVGRVRTKFGGTNLFGGGSVNGSDLLQEGQQEKEKLTAQLQQEYTDVAPPMFFIG